jgi:hypothetical protein
MEASSFLTDDRVTRVVTTTVARTYLATDDPPQGTRSSSEVRPPDKVDAFREDVSDPCLVAASAVERLLNQLGDCADRIVRPRGGGLAFIFINGDKYAMLECDEEGTTAAMLSDRSIDSEAETWVVDSNGLTGTVRKIRAFLGAPRAAYP